MVMPNACLIVKNIGKPDAGKLHVRFDEGGQGETCSLLYLKIPGKTIQTRPIGGGCSVPDSAYCWRLIISGVHETHHHREKRTLNLLEYTI